MRIMYNFFEFVILFICLGIFLFVLSTFWDMIEGNSIEIRKLVGWIILFFAAVYVGGYLADEKGAGFDFGCLAIGVIILFFCLFYRGTHFVIKKLLGNKIT
jgi:hypothetical protein